MSNPINKIKNRGRVAVIASLASFVIILFVFLMFLYNYSMRIREDNESKVTVSYYSLVDDIRDFRNQNISLLSGFEAYIQLNDDYEDAEIYRYLDFLLKDQLHDIRNIGIFIDTTIRWVYPLEGNESAIGVDLSKNSEQAEEVRRVKENLETLFVGPIDLIQGGSGFIIRMPLLKNSTYWGMVSIVLKAENAFGFVDAHTELYKVDYLITTSDEKEEVVYGNEAILEMKPLRFTTEDTLGRWNVYVVPTGGWDNQNVQIIFIFIIGLSISILIAGRVFFWIRNYNQVLSDKIELESKYILDRFTKIYTKEYFNLRLKEEFSHAQRHNYPISMIYFDLDHFKNVNDNYGHAAGDDVLLQVVKVVKSIIRTEDVFSRWGGDEFILLLPHTELKDVQYVAERICHEIAYSELCRAYGVTSSIGCSEWKQGEYLESWFLRTDKALYVSKNTGKNKVTVSDHNTEKNVLTKVIWNEASNSGCSIIDEEHKLILERCNVIVESALQHSALDETIRNVDALLIEMEEHFNDEIQILKDAKYPEVEKHQRIHNALMEKTREIYQKTIQREINAVEFFSFLLLTVVEGHFKNEDVKYFKYLSEHRKDNLR